MKKIFLICILLGVAGLSHAKQCPSTDLLLSQYDFEATPKSISPDGKTILFDATVFISNSITDELSWNINFKNLLASASNHTDAVILSTLKNMVLVTEEAKLFSPLNVHRAHKSQAYVCVYHPQNKPEQKIIATLIEEI